jgi:hypothetical protein
VARVPRRSDQAASRLNVIGRPLCGSGNKCQSGRDRHERVMTRCGPSHRRGAGREPPTQAQGVAERRHIIRAVSAMFGLCVVAAVIVADNEIRPGNTAALISDFPQLQHSVKAAIGIALAPVGGSETPLSLGEWHEGPAWSTMKVPLVFAALREESSPHMTDQMSASITQSDNAAAEAIWAGLGDPVTAAGKVDAVLAETGDFTRVQFRRVYPEFSSFGQTDWPLTEQVRFLSMAACDSRNTPVLTLMGQIEQDQRWGLGTIAGTRFKGGWGPGPPPEGKYLVRQMGLIITPTGTSAVAVAAEPYSGSLADGIRALNQIAEWLSDHIVMLPGGRCPHQSQESAAKRPVRPRSGRYFGRIRCTGRYG